MLVNDNTHISMANANAPKLHTLAHQTANHKKHCCCRCTTRAQGESEVEVPYFRATFEIKCAGRIKDSNIKRDEIHCVSRTPTALGPTQILLSSFEVK